LLIVDLIKGLPNQVQAVGMSAINAKLQQAAGGAAVNFPEADSMEQTRRVSP
jgi:hypothetical protein